MQLLLKYLRPQQKTIFLALLFAAVSQVLSMIDPIIFGSLIRISADFKQHPEHYRSFNDFQDVV